MALDDLNFLKNFEVEGAWDGIGWGGGRGSEGRGCYLIRKPVRSR